MQSLIIILVILFISLGMMLAVEVKPKLELAQDPSSGIANLRQILYPTYFSREPFEMDKWDFYGGNLNKAYLWNSNPISRYSDLFDRNLRSPSYVFMEKIIEPVFSWDNQIQLESREKPEFLLEKSNFLPMYTGRGRR